VELAQQFAASGPVMVILGPEFVLLEVDTNAPIRPQHPNTVKTDVLVLTGTVTVEDAIHPNGREVKVGQQIAKDWDRWQLANKQVSILLPIVGRVN